MQVHFRIQVVPRCDGGKFLNGGASKAGNGSGRVHVQLAVRRIVGRIAGVIRRIIRTDVLAFHEVHGARVF